jgi:hypothetical protein
MANNVKVQGSAERTGDEAQINVVETDKGLTIEIPSHLKVSGLPTQAGNLTIATTHGNVMLPSGLNLSINLWQRGSQRNPRKNVSVK